MPRQNDIILSPSVGEYQTALGWAPFYAARKHELRNENGMLKPADCHVVQVLVPAIGELTWINVHPRQVRLHNLKLA